MCGITGIFKKKKLINLDLKIQKKLLKGIRHRGPTSSGSFKAKNYSTACSRLSIVDQRKISDIPFETSKSVLSYNGQIYNFNQLKKKLKLKHGVVFKTKSDTELFIRGYEIYGNRFFNMCDGMFAAAIYSKKQKSLILVVDPLSIKNLYFYYDVKNESIQFSSESKNLNRINKLGVNFSIIKEWFMNNQINHEKSFFNKVQRVKGGTILKFDKNLKQSKKKYFDLKNSLSKKKVVSNFFLDDLINIDEYRAVEEKKTAILLSGGIDSVLISEMLVNSKKNNSKFYSYTADVKCRNFSEKSKVKSHLKNLRFNKSRFVEVTKKNLIDGIFQISKKSSLPLIAPNALVFYKLMEQIKKDKIKVCFTGDGADEFFNGYRWSKETKENFFLTNTSGLNEKTYNKFFYKDSINEKNYLIKKKTFYKDIKNIGINYKTRFYSQNIYLDKWLRTRDELGMANGIEIRVPFCDTKIIETTNSVSHRSSLLKNKKILLDSSKLFNKKNKKKYKKNGFPVPFSSFTSKELILKVLNKTNFSKFEIFKKNEIYKILDNKKLFFKYRIFIWQLFSFCIWEKQHNYS
jgi:asparagine synthase (glutamine-hydrolysing)